jgi:competence protein ComEC
MKAHLFAAVLTAFTFSLPAKDLQIHFVDVEGGQATLIVTPGGQSLLVDAGWPGFDGRDANRIVAAAKKAGVSKIDYLVLTHYHRDHSGGIEQLAERFPVGTFVNHGSNTETGAAPDELSASYARAAAKGKTMVVKPGDKIPLKGVDVTVVTARGERITKPLPGAGQANALCSAAKPGQLDPTENARSLGIVVRYGKFRFFDIGDLTVNKELELVCPSNLIGKVDVYLTTHHGLDSSGPAALVHALAPRVAIMNKASPGLEDLWQVHYSIAGGSNHNVDEPMIANMEENCAGHGLSITASENGAFKVTNTRNGHTKSYAARK